jgi:hypothetical protein
MLPHLLVLHNDNAADATCRRLNRNFSVERHQQHGKCQSSINQVAVYTLYWLSSRQHHQHPKHSKHTTQQQSIMNPYGDPYYPHTPQQQMPGPALPPPSEQPPLADTHQEGKRSLLLCY